MTAQDFREALGATLPLPEWTEDMSGGDWCVGRRVEGLAQIEWPARSAAAVVWYLGPENEPRRAADQDHRPIRAGWDPGVA